MTPMYRKTLLALAISASALPLTAHAVTLAVDDGLLIENTTYSDNVEFTGSYNRSCLAADYDVIHVNTVTFDQNLILNATINASGTDISGVDFIPHDDSQENRIKGDLVNKGNISLTGQAGSAILLDTATIIEGDLRNEGILSVKDDPYMEPAEDAGGEYEWDVASALDFGDSAMIEGNLVNAANGQISAEGTEAIGIALAGGRIGGKLINHGLIQVSGAESAAIRPPPLITMAG